MYYRVFATYIYKSHINVPEFFSSLPMDICLKVLKIRRTMEDGCVHAMLRKKYFYNFVTIIKRLLLSIYARIKKRQCFILIYIYLSINLLYFK